MEDVVFSFNNFLLENGIIDKNGIKYLESQTRYENNHNKVERNVINNLADYMFSLCKERTAQNMSKNIYDCFIQNDDKNILRIFRKVFIIYKFKLRNLVSRYFFKLRECLIDKKANHNINNLKDYSYLSDKMINKDIPNTRDIECMTSRATSNKNDRNNLAESKYQLQIQSSRNISSDDNNNKNKIVKQEIIINCLNKNDAVGVNKVEQFTVLPKHKSQYTLSEKLYNEKLIKELGQKSIVKEMANNNSSATKKKVARSKSTLIDPNYIKIEENLEPDAPKSTIFDKYSPSAVLSDNFMNKLQNYNKKKAAHLKLTKQKTDNDIKIILKKSSSLTRKENIIDKEISNLITKKDVMKAFEKTTESRLNSKDNKKYLRDKNTGKVILIDDLEFTSENNNNTSQSRLVNNPLLDYKKNPLIKDKVVKEMRNKYGHYSSINTDTVREENKEYYKAQGKEKVKQQKPMKPYSFQPIPDSRLFDLANQYLTTDESLEQFQNEQKKKGTGDIITSSSNICTTNNRDSSRRVNYLVKSKK